MRDKTAVTQAAHRRAAVRRSNSYLAMLYVSQIMKTSERGPCISQIAAPGGGPAMRGAFGAVSRTGRPLRFKSE
ncbi:hypothetical protein [Roseovarius pacificus]|uniref:hypothetical protein n=1 Tax=Roseovarius pacificus TaxID=337701 RepID=UPI001356299E|nr:hypothetical protein [Roseovarius pacificus]